jgi:hypothetical protein
MIRALAVSGALMVAASVLPAMEQGEKRANVGARATDASAAATASASTPVAKADIKKAISHIRRAWGSDAPCSGAARCAAYFESFGAALMFSDGTIVPLAHEQRLNRSGHDCIQEARASLHQGNRALAVQWVMAAHLDNPLTRNWLADHPDAVLEGLSHFGD